MQKLANVKHTAPAIAWQSAGISRNTRADVRSVVTQDGHWHHAAFVIEPGVRLDVFLDGENVSGDYSGGNIADTANGLVCGDSFNGQDLVIGALPANFGGVSWAMYSHIHVTDAKLWHHAFSDAQIKNLYDAERASGS